MDTERVISFTKSEGARGESSRFFDEKVRNGFYAKFIRKGTVVDIGYKGSGNQPLFTESIGLDTDTPNYNGRDFPWPDESIGTVICSHVLEHVADYGHFLREIFRVLKPGGTAILAVPLKDVYERKDVPPSRFNGDHKRFYTVQRLLYEIETSVQRNLYKVVFLEEHFSTSDLQRPETLHACGAYEIECVLEKLAPMKAETDPQEYVIQKDIAENIVKALYQFFLFRKPDIEGLKSHTQTVLKLKKQEGWLGLLEAFSSSQEFKSKINNFKSKRLQSKDEYYPENSNIDIETILKFSEYDTTKQRNLLVTGFPRSGTSAMVSLLNFSRQIFITHEFFPCRKDSWLPSSFTQKNHIQKYLDEINAKYPEERREDEMLRRIFPETEVSCSPIWDRIVDGRFLYNYCMHKINHARQNYESYKIVADKQPYMLAIRIFEKLILNKQLSVIAIIREPNDIYLSYLEKIRRDASFPFQTDVFEEELEESFKIIAALQKYCPERIICVKYEGFYESEERIRRLFARLNIDHASLHEEGIRYVCERARLLSQRRPGLHTEILQRNHLEYDPSRFDHLKHIIDWTTVI